MDVNQLRRLKPELETFLDRYAGYFGRADTHLQARRLVYGLLNGTDRRNVENIAEAVKGGVVRTLQKFITEGSWRDDDVLGELRTHVVEVLGDDNAVMCVDETGFPKKGTKSVGVKRQYSGILGRVDNCQIGVFINYVSQGDHLLIDRRLYLPEEWANDWDRRAAAYVPEEVVFRTKPELALEMVADAVAHNMPFRFVTGDSVYGDSPPSCRASAHCGSSMLWTCHRKYMCGCKVPSVFGRESRRHVRYLSQKRWASCRKRPGRK